MTTANIDGETAHDGDVIPCRDEQTAVLVWAAAAAAGSGGIFPSGVLAAWRLRGERPLSAWGLLAAGEAACVRTDDDADSTWQCSRPGLGDLAYGGGASCVSLGGCNVIITGPHAQSFARRVAAGWEMLHALTGEHADRAAQARAEVEPRETAYRLALHKAIDGINADLQRGSFTDESEWGAS